MLYINTKLFSPSQKCALVGPVYFTVAILGYWPETRSFSSDANFGSVASRLDTSNGSRILGYYMRFSHILIKCFSRLANVMMPPISSLTMEERIDQYLRTIIATLIDGAKFTCLNIHVFYIHSSSIIPKYR